MSDFLQTAKENYFSALEKKKDSVNAVSSMIEKQIRLVTKKEEIELELESCNADINWALSGLRESIKTYIKCEEKLEHLSKLAPPPEKEEPGTVLISGENERGEKISEEIPIGGTSKQAFKKVDR